jgi:formylmethanofuran dehydrogenase subunit E
MDQYTRDRLTCTMCGELQETYSEVEYSRGDPVCRQCKKKTQQSDNDAYDRWATSPNR